MRWARDTADAVCAVEALMLQKYKAEPFHNLYLLNNVEPPWPLEFGGTCSDKTLSFLRAARSEGFIASLHSGYIGGEEIHRLARIEIGSRLFFADVGNGWPALKLYPLDREVSYDCFGMRFRTEIHGEHMTVFHRRNEVETRQLAINFRARPEHELTAAIASRFSSGITYPFSTSVRFARVVGDRFLFLRGDRLEIYGQDTFESIHGINAERLPEALLDYFGFDIRLLRTRSPPTNTTVP